MSSDMLKIADLDAPQREALTRLIMTLADSKRLMGIRYSNWLLGAPSIETGIAASSMTQDEWGHARLLYAMLKECDLDPGVVEHERAAQEYTSVGVLDEPFADWAAVVAGMVLVDGAISVALRAFAEGRCEAAGARVPKTLPPATTRGTAPWSKASPKNPRPGTTTKKLAKRGPKPPPG